MWIFRYVEYVFRDRAGSVRERGEQAFAGSRVAVSNEGGTQGRQLSELRRNKALAGRGKLIGKIKRAVRQLTRLNTPLCETGLVLLS